MHSSVGGTGGSASVEKPGKSGITRQMNMFLRTKSDSGKRLSDAVSNNGSRKFGTYSNDCFWFIVSPYARAMLLVPLSVGSTV